MSRILDRLDATIMQIMLNNKQKVFKDPSNNEYLKKLIIEQTLCPNENSIIIPETQMNNSSLNECSICQEFPKFKDSIVTNCCRHHYCKKCWISWMMTKSKTCPTCRQFKPETSCYTHEK